MLGYLRYGLSRAGILRLAIGRTSDTMAAVGQRQPWVLGLVFTLALVAFLLIAQHSILGQTTVSYDTDSDGLIEITSAAQLNAIRWDTDGDGTPGIGERNRLHHGVPQCRIGHGLPGGRLHGL